MIDNFSGKTAVLTGAGSGFGLECARIAAQRGMNLVLVDVQQDALDQVAIELTEQGAVFRPIERPLANPLILLAGAVGIAGRHFGRRSACAGRRRGPLLG